MQQSTKDILLAGLYSLIVSTAFYILFRVILEWNNWMGGFITGSMQQFTYWVLLAFWRLRHGD